MRCIDRRTTKPTLRTSTQSTARVHQQKFHPNIKHANPTLTFPTYCAKCTKQTNTGRVKPVPTGSSEACGCTTIALLTPVGAVGFSTPRAPIEKQISKRQVVSVEAPMIHGTLAPSKTHPSFSRATPTRQILTPRLPPRHQIFNQNASSQ